MLEFVFVLAYRASAKLLLAASIESWPQVLQNDGRLAELQMFQWNTITNESLCEWEMMASFWKHQRALFVVSNKQFELHRVQPQTNRSVFQFEEARSFWDVWQIFDPLSLKGVSCKCCGTWCVNRVQATFLIYGWTALNSVKKGCPPYFKLDIHLLVRLPIRNESGCQEQVGWRTWHRLHLIAHIVAFRWTIRALFSSAVVNNIRW